MSLGCDTRGFDRRRIVPSDFNVPDPSWPCANIDSVREQFDGLEAIFEVWSHGTEDDKNLDLGRRNDPLTI